MNNKYFCVHAHFDLAARENPWLDDADEDATASPFRDWRERVFHDCYGPNSAAPLTDREGRVLELRDNYRDMSFDFGPELLDWIEREQPRVYGRILEADAVRLRDHGRGNALASAYPALVLPPASPRDRRTAVLWGVGDFRRRFAREPDGIVLPDGAADAATLELLAQCGLRFTLLPASAAAAVRPAGSDAGSPWTPVDADTVDVTRPYRWSSGSGRQLAIFFQRAGLAPARWRGAQEGRSAAARLTGTFTTNDAAQLAHVAVDGHVFGHLQSQGHRALAAMFDELGQEGPARRAGYAEFLDLFPAPQEVALHSKGDPAARSPLREALERLAAELDARFEARCRGLLKDPWKARDAYGPVSLADATTVTQAFLDRYSARHLDAGAARETLRLCEGQRRRLQMLSSGLETAQALAYAARAVDLLQEGPRDALDAGFLASLETDAAKTYRSLSKGSKVDLERAAAHFCVTAHLDEEPSGVPISDKPSRAFHAATETLWSGSRVEAGAPRSLSVSRVALRRARTYEEGAYLAVVHHKAALDVDCWVAPEREPSLSPAAADALAREFASGDAEGFRQAAEKTFGPARFGLDALFPTERRRAVQRLLPHGPPARREFLDRWGRALKGLRANPADPAPVAALLPACAEAGLIADSLGAVRLFRQSVTRAAEDLASSGSAADLERLSALLETVQGSGLHVNVWEIRDLALRGLGKMRSRLKLDRIDCARRLAGLLGFSEALLLPSPAGAGVGGEVS